MLKVESKEREEPRTTKKGERRKQEENEKAREVLSKIVGYAQEQALGTQLPSVDRLLEPSESRAQGTRYQPKKGRRT